MNFMKIAKLSALLIACTIAGGTVVAAEKDGIGITLLAKGDVTASGADQEVRKLKRRSAIHQADVLKTGKESRAQFRMKDGAVVALQSDTSLSLLEYRYQEAGTSDSVIMKLTKGGLRTITGAVGKDDPKDYRLETPLATIGIRGTVYEAELIGSELYVAFWKGWGKVVAPGCDVSLGDGHPYRIVRVGAAGDCDLVEFDAAGGKTPFSAGHSMDPIVGVDDDDELSLKTLLPTSGDPDMGTPILPSNADIDIDIIFPNNSLSDGIGN